MGYQTFGNKKESTVAKYKTFD